MSEFRMSLAQRMFVGIVVVAIVGILLWFLKGGDEDRPPIIVENGSSIDLQFTRQGGRWDNHSAADDGEVGTDLDRWGQFIPKGKDASGLAVNVNGCQDSGAALTVQFDSMGVAETLSLRISPNKGGGNRHVDVVLPPSLTAQATNNTGAKVLGVSATGGETLRKVGNCEVTGNSFQVTIKQ
ncbi:MAG: hypothetical protein R2752_12950 [Vicinamibacterales bacterium]